jgi:hypothetical protein
MGFSLFSHLRRIRRRRSGFGGQVGYGGQACPSILLPAIHFCILPS